QRRARDRIERHHRRLAAGERLDQLDVRAGIEERRDRRPLGELLHLGGRRRLHLEDELHTGPRRRRQRRARLAVVVVGGARAVAGPRPHHALEFLLGQALPRFGYQRHPPLAGRALLRNPDFHGREYTVRRKGAMVAPAPTPANATASSFSILPRSCALCSAPMRIRASLLVLLFACAKHATPVVSTTPAPAAPAASAETYNPEPPALRLPLTVLPTHYAVDLHLDPNQATSPPAL